MLFEVEQNRPAKMNGMSFHPSCCEAKCISNKQHANVQFCEATMNGVSEMHVELGAT
jgi:hypothetical protein